MADQLQIPDDELVPGDLIDAYYQIQPGTSDYLVSAAIGDVKKSLASDPRFHYQGSRLEPLRDPDDGQTYQYLIVTLQVADPSKITGHHPAEPGVQEAGVLLPLIVVVTVLSGLLASALYSGAIKFKSFQITRTAEISQATTIAIINSKMSDSAKQAAFNAQAASAKAQNGSSSGSTFAGAIGSLTTVAIIIGVLWAASLSHRDDRIH